LYGLFEKLESNLLFGKFEPNPLFWLFGILGPNTLWGSLLKLFYCDTHKAITKSKKYLIFFIHLKKFKI